MLEKAGIKPTQFDRESLGTVGRGNHFAELQVIKLLYWNCILAFGDCIYRRYTDAVEKRITAAYLRAFYQVVERIEDEEAAAPLGLTERNVYVCVHSGSRGYGESILHTYSKQYGGAGIHLVGRTGHLLSHKHYVLRKLSKLS